MSSWREDATHAAALLEQAIDLIHQALLDRTETGGDRPLDCLYEAMVTVTCAINQLEKAKR